MIPIAVVLRAEQNFRDNYLGGIRIKKGMNIYVFSNGVFRVGEFMFPHERAQHLIDHPWVSKVEERTKVVVESGASLNPSLYETVVVSTSVRPVVKPTKRRIDLLNFKGAIDGDFQVVGSISDTPSANSSVTPDIVDSVSLETGEQTSDMTVVDHIEDGVNSEIEVTEQGSIAQIINAEPVAIGSTEESVEVVVQPDAESAEEAPKPEKKPTRAKKTTKKTQNAKNTAKKTQEVKEEAGSTEPKSESGSSEKKSRKPKVRRKMKVQAKRPKKKE